MSNKHIPIKHGEWQDGICGCCSGGLFWQGFCCPCFLVNRTQALLDDEVPDDKEPPKCGAMGIGHCLVNMWTGCTGGFLFGCWQREKIRTKHRIDGGNRCGDFCINGCLPCCALIQQYKEVDLRRKEQIRVNNKGYRQNPEMHHG